MSPELFDRSRLSGREDAILEAAIEGMTDIQIAGRLDISQSTVNSYWVRIRGKLGQLSRTELVALALKAKAKIEIDEVNAQLAVLQQEVQTNVRVSEDYANIEIYRAALDAMPEPVLVCCEKGLIRYANARLERMFGYGIGELIDRSVTILLAPGLRGGEESRIAAYMREPGYLRIGFSEVVYAVRRDGAPFRVALLLDARPTSTGIITTCIVRDFVTELDTRREHMASRIDALREGWNP